MGNVNEMVATAEEFGPPVDQGAELVPPEWRDEEDDSVHARWRITTTQGADWAMSRLAALQAEVESIHAQAEAARERIAKREAELVARADRGAAFFRFRLSEYAQTNRDALLGGGKRKSRDMLHGRIGWRSRKGKLVVTDRAALVAWLERQPPESGLFRIKVEPEMAALQEHFAKTNALPPGTEYDVGGETFYVDVESPETGLEKRHA